MDAREHQPVGDGVLQARHDGDGAPLLLAPAARAADRDRPVEEGPLERRRRLASRQHAGVDLLVDARHRGHEVRARRGHVLRQRVDAAGEGGGRPRRDAEVLDQARERVGERQEEEVDVALVNQPGPERRLDGCEVVAVRLHDALRGSGRARRVHDGRHVVPGERRHASLDLGPEPWEGRSPPLDEGAQRPLPRRVVDRDDPAEADRLPHAVELEPPCRHLVDLGALLGVLDDDDRRLGVGDDVAALGGQARLVDRDGECAAGEDRKVDLDPLRTRRGEDGDAVADAYAVVHERRGDLQHVGFHLGPGRLAPAVPRAVAVAGPAREVAGPREEHLREIREPHAWRSGQVPYNR